MRKWPDDYHPVFDVDVTVDDTTIDEEPFQPPTEAAVYALQMRHLINAAVSYTQFARDRNHQQTAEQTAETTPNAARRGPGSGEIRRRAQRRSGRPRRGASNHNGDQYAGTGQVPKSGKIQPPPLRRGSSLYHQTRKAGSRRSPRAGGDIPSQLLRNLSEETLTPQRRRSSGEHPCADQGRPVDPAQAGIVRTKWSRVVRSPR